MHVQKLLRDGATLADLTRDFAIRVTEHPSDPLVVLNYDQIESRPKSHPVIRECRGLVLERGTWNIEARAFGRFFNFGEELEEQAKFDWSEVHCQEKADGSLALLYRYNGTLRVNTRGSFAQLPVMNSLTTTWEQLFWSTGIDRDAAEKYVDDDRTLVFELCSPLNKIVRRYDKPTAYLLSAFHNTSGAPQDPDPEYEPAACDWWAKALKVLRPRVYHVTHHSHTAELLARETDPTFEGFVVRDKHGQRVKVKSAKYVALHHLKGDGDNLFNPKHLLPFILGGAAEEEELLTYFPEVKPLFQHLKTAVNLLRDEIEFLWAKHKGLESQKDFAMAVKHSVGSGFLFEARKRGVEVERVWGERAVESLEKWVKSLPGVPHVAASSAV